MNIDEFVERVNQELKAQSIGAESVDARQKEGITVRRVRDYLAKKLITTPIKKIGKELEFEDEHVQELVELRRLQSLGVSDATYSKALSTAGITPASKYSDTNSLNFSASSLSSAQSSSGFIGVNGNAFDGNAALSNASFSADIASPSLTPSELFSRYTSSVTQALNKSDCLTTSSAQLQANKKLLSPHPRFGVNNAATKSVAANSLGTTSNKSYQQTTIGSVNIHIDQQLWAAQSEEQKQTDINNAVKFLENLKNSTSSPN